MRLRRISSVWIMSLAALILCSTGTFAQDGTQKWAFLTGDEVLSSPAIGEDGTIYVGSFDAHLYAINPNGTQKWAFPTGDVVASSPAVGGDGTIYVGSYDTNLYAINGSSGGVATSGWPMFHHDLKHTGQVKPSDDGPCTGTAQASTYGVFNGGNIVYGSSDLLKHMAYFLLPLGAVIVMRIWRRRR